MASKILNFKGNFNFFLSYIEPNDEKSNANERIEISRNISKRKVVFEVRNDVLNFKQETWKRLVAVFIEGVKNEFREWPDGNKPAILFAKSYLSIKSI